MAELEDIYEDKTAWVCFEGETGQETIGIYARCQDCGRYVKHGRLQGNMLSELRLLEWICKIHGEIQPYWERWDNEE